MYTRSAITTEGKSSSKVATRLCVKRSADVKIIIITEDYNSVDISCPRTTCGHTCDGQ